MNRTRLLEVPTSQKSSSRLSHHRETSPAILGIVNAKWTLISTITLHSVSHPPMQVNMRYLQTVQEDFISLQVILAVSREHTFAESFETTRRRRFFVSGIISFYTISSPGVLSSSIRHYLFDFRFVHTRVYNCNFTLSFVPRTEKKKKRKVLLLSR